MLPDEGLVPGCFTRDPGAAVLTKSSSGVVGGAQQTKSSSGVVGGAQQLKSSPGVVGGAHQFKSSSGVGGAQQFKSSSGVGGAQQFKSSPGVGDARRTLSVAGGYNRCVQLLVSMGLTIPFGGGQPTDPFIHGCEPAPLPGGSSAVWVVPSLKLLPKKKIPRLYGDRRPAECSLTKGLFQDASRATPVPRC